MSNNLCASLSTNFQTPSGKKIVLFARIVLPVSRSFDKLPSRKLQNPRDLKFNNIMVDQEQNLYFINMEWKGCTACMVNLPVTLKNLWRARDGFIF